MCVYEGRQKKHKTLGIIFWRAGPLKYRCPSLGECSRNPSVSVHQLALLWEATFSSSKFSYLSILYNNVSRHNLYFFLCFQVLAPIFRSKTHFFFNFYVLRLFQLFPPLHPSAQPAPHLHSQSSPCCLCPWVLHICSMTNPFTFFQTYPLPLLLSVYSMILCLWFYFAY